MTDLTDGADIQAKAEQDSIEPSYRWVRVKYGGEMIANTHRPYLLFETDLPTRY
jgi:uncharacterized protein (DUF427 family)